MKRLRILVLTLRIPYPLLDGGAVAMYGLIKGLHDAGHNIDLCALNTQKHWQDPAVMRSVVDQVVATPIDTQPRIFPAIQNLLFESTAYNIQRFWSPAYADQLKTLLNQQQFDIIQLEGVYLAQYLPVIRAHSQAPVVLRAHNVEYHIWQRMAQHAKHPIKRWYFNVLAERGAEYERKQLHNFDGIAAISEEDRQAFQDLGYIKPLINLPSGVAVEPVQQPMQPLPNSVAFLGSLEWLPNQQGLSWFMNNVWPQVLQAVPEATFHLAGRNAPEWIADWGKHRPQVHFYGTVPDAAAFLANKAVVIVPLQSGSGIRIKVIEAMMLHKAIVSTTIGIGGIPAIDGTHVLLADSAEHFAAQLTRLLTDPSMSDQLANQGFELAQSLYTWTAIVQRLTDFYQEIIQHTRAKGVEKTK
jgi:polysaccharide biosynthesis protein PslH